MVASVETAVLKIADGQVTARLFRQPSGAWTLIDVAGIPTHLALTVRTTQFVDEVAARTKVSELVTVLADVVAKVAVERNRATVAIRDLTGETA